MMKIFKIYQNSVSSKIINQEILLLAYDFLKKGKIIAIPSDTIYGIVCLAQKDDCIKRIYEIKKRDKHKPLAICVNNLNDLHKWCKVTVEDKILNSLLPGPVTLVFERTKNLNKNLNPSTNLIGIRIPDNDFIQNLTNLYNPLILTSANLSNKNSSRSIEEFKKIWLNLDAIFDGGILNDSDTCKLGSTVVDLSVKGKFKIIRNGCALKQVIKILKNENNLDQL